MKNEEWPEYVPVLTAYDICKETLGEEGGDKHCLLGWVNHVLSYSYGIHPLWDELHAAVQREAGGTPLPHFNDTHTLEENAEVWNRAMRKLGYTEVVDA